MYHKICVKLSKFSKDDVSDWLCKHCRPVIFPFHNVDYKTLMKLSTNVDKYSFDTLSESASNFKRLCSICSKNLSKNNPGIPCYSCNSKVHVKCSGINDHRNTFHLYKGNWQCKKCHKDKFPFSDLDQSDFINLGAADKPAAPKYSEYSIDEKLKILLSQAHSSNWYAHNTPDKWDHPDNTNVKPNFAYYDIPDFNKSRQTWDQTNSLSIFHTNISSIQANTDKMIELLADLSWSFDVLALSETWNDEKTQNSFSPAPIPGYLLYDGTTGSSLKGGCGFYVKSNITTIPRKDLEFEITDYDAQTENFWIEIVNEKGSNTVVGVFYRHPSNKHDEFMKNLETKLKIIKKENKKTIICGDFNVNLLNFYKDKSVNKFLCTMLDYGFHPCITEPTRITNSNKPSLVDNIFVNTFDDPVAGNILEQISYDHLPNFVILNHVHKKKEKNIMKRNKKNFDAIKFNEELLDNDLLLKLLNAKNTDEASNIFLSKYCKLLDVHAPLRKMTKKEIKLKQNPWMTQGLLKSISKKRLLFKKLKGLIDKNKNTDNVHKKYKTYNDMINKLKKKCKRDYYQNYFNENCKDSKKIWSGINKLLNKSCKKQGTIFLEENGLISDPPQSCE